MSSDKTKTTRPRPKKRPAVHVPPGKARKAEITPPASGGEEVTAGFKAGKDLEA